MFKVKYLSLEEIRHTADRFREKVTAHSHPPIDVVYVAEVSLKLDIIPLANLFADHYIDAALLPDLSGLYIDEKAYMDYGRYNRWVERRLRFSIAHELAHLVLHGHDILSNKFASLDEYKCWAGDSENYKSPEYQADEFAGRFLVPLDILLAEYKRIAYMAQKNDPDWRKIEGAREKLAKKLAPLFGVSSMVIETRLDREGIWPVE